jgi:sec-independent protein translocase protein TatB
MFDNLNGWEVIILALLALFIFGPERLPKVISEAVRVIRALREMARNATNDLSREIGTEVKLEDLHPKTFIRKHLLSEEDEQTLRKPFEDLYHETRQLGSEVADAGRSATTTPSPRSYDEPRPTNGEVEPRTSAHTFDADAT